MADRLTAFRDHARRMAEAEHKPDCPHVTAVEPYWPPGGWAPIDADGNWDVGGTGIHGLGWLGPKPEWSPPPCDGCITDADRAQWRRLANEVDDYRAGDLVLFGDQP